MKKIAIIGGGAAGMMAAAAILEAGAGLSERVNGIEVVMFEKNGCLGRKVSISGGGRCNVTTGIPDVRKVLENYPRGAKFLMSAMFRFPPRKVMDWFADRGVKLVVEDDLRVFPASGKGDEVVSAVEKYLRKLGVRIRYGATVTSVKFVPRRKGEGGAVGDGAASSGIVGSFVLEMKNRAGGNGEFERFAADELIITTGGSAYAQTGSAGDGYEFAKTLGHTITKLAPALGALTVAEEYVKDLAGVSVTKALLELRGDVENPKGKSVYRRTGPFVFTHNGVSGPAVFALQSMAAFEKYSRENPLELVIDFFPNENRDALKARLQKTIEQNGKKNARNLLDMFLPKSLCGSVLRVCGIAESKVCGNLSKVQREKLTGALKGFLLHVTGTSGGEEFVTAGGVKLEEIDSATMESKICPGLYFAGEILDVDGFTGGFNLQAAWATGRLAGESAAVKLSGGLR